MSKESAQKFLQDLSSKSELMQEVNESVENIYGGGDGLKYLCDFANKRGYDFSLEEMKMFMKESNEILNYSNLANVAGGVDWKSIAKSAGGAAVTSLLSSYMQNGTLSMDDVKSAAMSAFKEGKSKW